MFAASGPACVQEGPMAGRRKKQGDEKAAANGNGNGGNLGFEGKMWAAADKLRGHIDAGEYKHVVLGPHRTDSFDKKLHRPHSILDNPATGAPADGVPLCAMKRSHGRSRSAPLLQLSLKIRGSIP
jgi:hypothetical protein